jgi:hypothetical protein
VNRDGAEAGTSDQNGVQQMKEVAWEVEVDDERVTNLEGAYVGFLV